MRAQVLHCVWCPHEDARDVIPASVPRPAPRPFDHPGLVVIKFYASWCRACKAMAPKIDAIAEEWPGVIDHSHSPIAPRPTPRTQRACAPDCPATAAAAAARHRHPVRAQRSSSSSSCSTTTRSCARAWGSRCCRTSRSSRAARARSSPSTAAPRRSRSCRRAPGPPGRAAASPVLAACRVPALPCA